MTSKQYVGEFEYRLEKLEIESYQGNTTDISRMFDSLSIYQSIHENHMHGMINIIDGIKQEMGL